MIWPPGRQHITLRGGTYGPGDCWARHAVVIWSTEDEEGLCPDSRRIAWSLSALVSAGSAWPWRSSRRASRTFLVVDRAGDLGGTWRDNTYPGLACDVPSNLYSFSFRPGRWSRRFPPRQEILAYLHALVSESGLGPHLRFGSGVAAAEFDERDAVWNLTFEDGGTLQATAVVSAVGQLNRPALPDIAGRDDFAGPSWHSARWNHDVDLDRPAGGRGRHRGKRHPVRARGRQDRRPPRRLPAQRPVHTAQVRPPLWPDPAGPLRPVPGRAQGRPAAHLPVR